MGNQVWVKVLQAFDCMLVQPPKTWMRLDRDVSVPTRPRDKKSIFAIILDALHHSRRLQAQRTLRQYHDLIDQAQRGLESESCFSGESQHVEKRQTAPLRVNRENIRV